MLMLLCRARCEEPEDCVQEAFIRLATQNPVPDDPLAWLSRVARNAAVSRSRSSQRRRQRERLAGEQRSAWFHPGSDPKPWEDVDVSRLESALQQLEQETAEIVIAHVWGGLTFRQIATAFSLPRTTIHRSYQAGLASLREKLLASPTPSIRQHPQP